jgi:hypothetical protein
LAVGFSLLAAGCWLLVAGSADTKSHPAGRTSYTIAETILGDKYANQ